MKRKIFKIQGMDCASCAQMVELDLEDAGFSASCSYPKEELEVQIEKEDDERKIKKIIEDAGYSLTL